MKLSLKILISVGTALLFSGCAGNTPKPLAEQYKRIENIGNHYYYIPISSDGFKLNKKLAYLNRVVSSSLLECKENYVFIQTAEAKKNIGKATNKYYASLTPAELIDLRKHPTKIPRRNSKEFQNIIKTETKYVRKGEAGCIPPMSKEKVKEYKDHQAQQAKINNDPRVVAARIQARAARKIAKAQISAANDRATWDNLNRQTAQMNYNTQQMLNRSNTYNVNVYHP